METVVETPMYLAAAARAGMSQQEMFEAVSLVAGNPLAGDLIVGTGGCRKVRLAGKGRGKSGGYRLFTFYKAGDKVFLLTVISKGQRANLSNGERNALSELVKAI